ncbi:CoA transferase [Vineibacter terrae]|uniref:CoA transferase n=1 Tax=Vineibacter terrae TaxID=2586908 RepID=A0A5C8PHV7_9HYPH|nr:CaiB/BaiF CoA-transferase family protein [Vineibacter terrae]TXL73259.1 CoA transferase [Vineibacter terrae]
MSLSLDGIRIVSLAEQYPGPYATLLLADMGADVILVERPGGGDPARQFPAFHAALNRNKRSVALDLKTEAGRQALRDLVGGADVLMEGFRPGTMERLGFGYDAMAALNPRLVYVSISGFGQTGPYRDRPAHDISYQAVAGFLFRHAETGSTANPGEVAVGDLSSGMFAALGTLAALFERTRTGRGKHVDVSMTDGLVSWMSVMIGPALNGVPIADIGAEPAYGLFRCADGKLLSLSIAHEDWFWRPFCSLIGMDDAAALTRGERVAQTQALTRRIADIMATRDRDAWGAALDAAGIPWGPVNGLAEAADDPHFRARGLFRRVDGSDGGTRWHVAQPLVFSGERPGPQRDAPRLGEHTEEILAPLAGTSTNG